MSDSKLPVVGKRLEATVLALSPSPVSATEMYALYEMLAIQILDSEHQEHPPGVLEAYLLGYLAALPLPH